MYNRYADPTFLVQRVGTAIVLTCVPSLRTLLVVYSLPVGLGILLTDPLCAQHTGTHSNSADQTTVAKAATAFLQSNCFDCHQGEQAEAALDLSNLAFDLADSKTQTRWLRIWQRVHDGEMPPEDYGKVDAKESDPFLHEVGNWIRNYQQDQAQRLGRARSRRLTTRELERTLHDLLGIDIPLAAMAPPEPRSAEFSTIFEGQSMSHFQLERHLDLVDAALDEAFRRALSPTELYKRDFDAQSLVRRSDRKRTREPELLNGRAVVWSAGVIYYGRIPRTTAPHDGWYRFTIRASALKPPKEGGVWTTVQSGPCVSSAPLLAWVGAFEAQPETQEFVFEAWMPEDHMLEIRPGDRRLKRGRFGGGQVGTGEGEPQDVPGIAIESIVMEQLHRGPDDDGVRKLLFGDIPLEQKSKKKPFEPVVKNAEQEAAKLLLNFAQRAFRRPTDPEQIRGYVNLVTAALKDGKDFTSALRLGYRAILCSPRFLYFIEQPGELDDFAVAARLSYMLTGGMPDDQLMRLAGEGRMHDPKVLHDQVERLLTGDGARRFIEDFAAEWLEMDQIEATEPDAKLVRDWDSIVQHTMLDETYTYLETMLQEDLSVTHLVDSDFTFLNSRLADFYDIDGVDGGELRRVKLKPEYRRGGVLTHGSVLKVTANGTNTSPVLRGVWVNERLLGNKIPPPPESVAAIEPDIRGAKTVRELLAKHRSDQACASCHRTIDPPGFALENYDPAGRWRDRYEQPGRSRSKSAPRIDASYVTADGQKFKDIDELKALLFAKERKLAHNVAEKLVVYGTGAPVSFADAFAIEQIVDQAAKDGYGFRSVLHAVVTSPLFRTK